MLLGRGRTRTYTPPPPNPRTHTRLSIPLSHTTDRPTDRLSPNPSHIDHRGRAKAPAYEVVFVLGASSWWFVMLLGVCWVVGFTDDDDKRAMQYFYFIHRVTHTTPTYSPTNEPIEKRTHTQAGPARARGRSVPSWWRRSGWCT